VFENRMLRLFRPKRDEVTGDGRKLHNEELRNLYSSPNIIRMTNSWRMRGMRIGYWWESQKRPVRRQRSRWVDNIKIDLREI
jgi:hypothetical protein